MSYFKSKTLWFSAALATLSTLQGYLHVFNLTPETQALVGISVSAVVAALRFVTTQPLDQK